MQVKNLTRLAILSSICIITRIYLNIIPNVKILSDVILILAIEKSLKESIFVNAITMVVTSFILGFGVWVLFQVADFFILAILNYLIFNVFNIKKTKMNKAIALGGSGLLYGLIITVMEAIFILGGMHMFIPRYMTSIPFDINHAVGNFIIYVLIIYPLEDYICGKKGF
ncbi:MAG: hypothetical protein SPI59_04900 [Finegoldia sp.]|nr:hypothetical protein [Finegoldia sp.]